MGLHAEWRRIEGMRGPVVYLSNNWVGHLFNGGFESYSDSIRFACCSYYYSRGLEKILNVFKANGARAFCDSGGFTFLQKLAKSGVNIDVSSARDYMRKYADWLKASEFEWDFAVAFDYEISQKAVVDSVRYLARLGVAAIPVFHNHVSITADSFAKYADLGHGLVCVSPRGASGRRLRDFYDATFDMAEKKGVKLHGLACTGGNMLRYPWYSVDSTSWILHAGLRREIVLKNRRFSMKERPGTPLWVLANANAKVMIDAGLLDCRPKRRTLW